MAYYFFLGVFPLPITPGELEITTPSGNETIRLINHGEINKLKSPGLTEISFDFLLPQQEYPFANYSLGSAYTATTAIPLLNELYESRIPFQFIVSRTAPGGLPAFFTNIKCQIENITYKESADDYGMDVMCSITLKEYKHYGATRIDVSKIVGVATAAAGTVVAMSKSRSTESKTTPKQYTVKKGDTLWNICKKELGDGSKYKEIAELNKLENPDKIYPGQVLRLS